MSVAGSSIYTDADGYQTSLQDILDLLVICPREFHARLTWVALPTVQLMRAEESSARIAYLRPPPEKVFVFFATHQGSALVHRGKELQFGDLVWHRDGRGHQRTSEGSRWGCLAVTAETLLSFGRSVAGHALSAPEHPQILRPAVTERRELLRVHAEASRIAETSPNRILNPEVVRALDQELIGLLIGCMETAAVFGDNPTEATQAQLCVQFEEMLQVAPFRLIPTKEICQTLRVSQRRFMTSCQWLLGMGPGQYQRLRRLKLVRSELTNVGVQRQDVREIMARYGFADLRRFIAEYRQVYGEMPTFPAREPL